LVNSGLNPKKGGERMKPAHRNLVHLSLHTAPRGGQNYFFKIGFFGLDGFDPFYVHLDQNLNFVPPSLLNWSSVPWDLD